ncbi:unnamed protein product [Blepharisma stoltei]|uniref:RGS domain-containing protein n=1 Tax=Blepharisma stoltei TaxID=1481888 RepID=A0AAU9J3S2_9CILI|nr:unnamed protein product [Blepharisma stoltei]
MAVANAILEGSWGFIIVSAIIFYGACVWYIYHKRDFQEIYARSPGILILSIIVNCVEVIGSISLGFIQIMGFYWEMKIALPVFIVYNTAHQIFYISNLLRMYRLNLLDKIRAGINMTHKEYLSKQSRLSNRWNLKIAVYYAAPVSLLFTGFAFAQSIVTDESPFVLDLIYNIMADSLTFFEEVGYTIFLFKIRKIKHLTNLKAELYLFLGVWSLGFSGPFIPMWIFHFYIVPIRNLSMLIITFISLYETSTHFHKIPISSLRDPRIILEDFTVYRYFRQFASRSANPLLMQFLEFLIKINLYKLEPSLEKAGEIYDTFLKDKDLIPDSISKGTIQCLIEVKDSINLRSTLFSDIEFYIYHQFDWFVYPEFTTSQEYRELLLETE